MLPVEEQGKTPDGIKNNAMEKINECTCTSAYYCPDENQWEPSHTCMNCRLEEYAYYQECMEEDSNKPVSTPSVETVDEDYDDLPF